MQLTQVLIYVQFTCISNVRYFVHLHDISRQRELLISANRATVIKVKLLLHFDQICCSFESAGESKQMKRQGSDDYGPNICSNEVGHCFYCVPFPLTFKIRSSFLLCSSPRFLYNYIYIMTIPFLFNGARLSAGADGTPVIVRIRTFTYVYMCMCICVCVYVYVYMCMCICVCVYVYVYMCMCICVHVYTCMRYAKHQSN